jgi:hypothetical protein
MYDNFLKAITNRAWKANDLALSNRKRSWYFTRTRKRFLIPRRPTAPPPLFLISFIQNSLNLYHHSRIFTEHIKARNNCLRFISFHFISLLFSSDEFALPAAGGGWWLGVCVSDSLPPPPNPYSSRSSWCSGRMKVQFCIIELIEFVIVCDSIDTPSKPSSWTTPTSILRLVWSWTPLLPHSLHYQLLYISESAEWKFYSSNSGKEDICEQAQHLTQSPKLPSFKYYYKCNDNISYSIYNRWFESSSAIQLFTSV